jgi:Tfp pilus assembly protein PilF
MRLICAVVALMFFPAAATAQDLPPDRTHAAHQHYKAGVELMSSESWEQAAAEFKAAIAIDKTMAMAHYNLGQCRMNQKRYAEAVTAYEDCRTAFEGLSGLSQKEREARDRHRRDEINELKDDLTRLKSLKGAGDTHTTETAMGMRMEERLRQLESMQSKDRAGDSMVPAGVYLALGSAYFRQGKLADAEREYRQALQHDPKLGAAHNNLAVIYLMSGKALEAEASMKLAEKNGFRVSPAFKDDVKAAKQKSQP